MLDVRCANSKPPRSDARRLGNSACLRSCGRGRRGFPVMSVASVQLTQHGLEFRGVQFAVAVGVELRHQLFSSRCRRNFLALAGFGHALVVSRDKSGQLIGLKRAVAVFVELGQDALDEIVLGRFFRIGRGRALGVAGSSARNAPAAINVKPAITDRIVNRLISLLL